MGHNHREWGIASATRCSPSVFPISIPTCQYPQRCHQDSLRLLAMPTGLPSRRHSRLDRCSARRARRSFRRGAQAAEGMQGFRHLGPSHPRRPHPNRWRSVARQSLPNLERPQHVRPHQAGLARRHEPRRLTSWMPVSHCGTATPLECGVNSFPYLTTIQPHQPAQRAVTAGPSSLKRVDDVIDFELAVRTGKQTLPAHERDDREDRVPGSGVARRGHRALRHWAGMVSLPRMAG